MEIKRKLENLYYIFNIIYLIIHIDLNYYFKNNKIMF
jgi:hypothetical protein